MTLQNLNHEFYDQVSLLISQARHKSYQAVNHIMVETYRYLGKMIVEEEQQGNQRADYGKFLIVQLSKKLTEQFGKGFGERNLRLIRQFYISFPILNAVSTQLSWTHYRVLMRIENPQARTYYLEESSKEHRSVRQLERQIYSQSYERILIHQSTDLSTADQDLHIHTIIKDPYIFEFTGIVPDMDYYESDIEKALINNLEHFLLELGRGFTFYARQKHIQTETSDFYIDLVFYNFHLKCFLIIDLKTTKLTHQDVGQMDMYVRMFDDLIKPEGDNPTIGLILCAEKDETIVKYSVLNDNKNLFASKYQLYLPTEQELQAYLDSHIRTEKEE